MFEGPVQRLIDELGRLPGIGQKTAQRLAFHLLAVEEADARRLATAIVDMREQVGLCSPLLQRRRWRRVWDLPGFEA